MSASSELGQKKEEKNGASGKTHASSSSSSSSRPSRSTRRQPNKQERTCACSRAATGETAEPGCLLPWGARRRRGRGASEGFGVIAEDDDVIGEQHLLLAATGRASVPAAAAAVIAVRVPPGAVSGEL